MGNNADAASAVTGVNNDVVQLVQGLVDGDIKRRQRFTQETVAAVSVQFPSKTIVMSHVGYSLSCTPDTKESIGYNVKVGSNVRYVPSSGSISFKGLPTWHSFDVLVFGNGCTFTLKGNGGFENVSGSSYVIMCDGCD